MIQPFAATGRLAHETGVRCMWMRGGTSKGGFFLASDLPREQEARDHFLLRVLGSPDVLQIDGMGGAHPLTSKVAVVRKSDRHDADVDYLFLQVTVDQPIVTDAQNCGNILAGVGPFAIERGIVTASEGSTRVRIFMENTGRIAVATVATPSCRVSYAGSARIDGVPGTAAPIQIAFEDIAGSTCGALLPTGNSQDEIAGVPVTMIDNGMPVVILRAEDVGVTGYESPAHLEANAALRQRLEEVRLTAGPLMNLGNVAEKTVPKMTLVARPQRGGAIATRTFIPHRAHSSIGVLGAISVATACLLPGSPAAGLADTGSGAQRLLSVEHPTGEMTVIATLDAAGAVTGAAILRTARKLFDGTVFAD